MHYADWKPAITTSELDSIMWTFSPGHAGILGNKRADVLVGSAEIRGTIIMDPPAVRAAVQEKLTAIMTEVSFTFDLLKEKKVAPGDGKHGVLHGPAKWRDAAADGDGFKIFQGKVVSEDRPKD